MDKNMFASDNYSGVCPEAWQAMMVANDGYANSYGDDIWTAKACDALRDFFETDCQVFFAFNGTAANSLALASLCRSYHSIICHDMAHVETDECGAVEFFSNGTKVLLVGGDEGKIDPAAVTHTVERRSDIHYPKPKVLSITQATELGTVYSIDELQAVGELAKHHQLKLHMDGARFSNALATLGVPAAELTWKAGVDVLTFGGTKNGMPVGEAVVFFDKSLAEEFDYRCKQAGQLASKMRYLAAPWVGMLEQGTLLKNAAHANKCAKLLAEQLLNVDGVTLMHQVQANAVFVQMPETLVEALHAAGWHFYTFIGSGHARFMCSWQSKEDDILQFGTELKKLAASL
ncbi:L-threonine aldolase [Malonomonas rubra DSM 5091]|uniref:L-threonine aldolase n=1 Tax=Malonomonas rubra DSM 5091 TaxID=1122189 RepID=A0A1M6FJZ4_MALRU|nr:low specificity L-threonine aldolase [Malonomonas rubra]SHI97995.1 L-threonine aldolase [Malonomonas rubra DSM 5091]